MQFVSWLIKTAGFYLEELRDSLKIDLRIVSGNIQEFLRHLVKPKYASMVKSANPLRKMLLCKEDKEQLIKSKIRVLTQLFVMVNAFSDDDLGLLDEFRAENEDDEIMDTQEAANSTLAALQDELFNLALQIMLVPGAHRLQLLVSDPVTEKVLRKQCQEFVKRRSLATSTMIKTSDTENDILQSNLDQLHR